MIRLDFPRAPASSFCVAWCWPVWRSASRQRNEKSLKAPSDSNISALRKPSPAANQPAGWFAAGDGFRKALMLLSDGAFRLFSFLCLEADRHTGQHQATQKELAGALGKSKRIIGNYVAELQAKGICDV